MTTVDLYVVVPGILGSTLYRNDKPIWAPNLGGVTNAILTFGKSLQRVQLPDGIGDGEPDDGVKAVDLWPDIHILPGLWEWNLGYSKLISWLRDYRGLSEIDRPNRPANLLLFAYDWRLSNRVSGRRLARAIDEPLGRLRGLTGNKSAKVNLICHSMGGLVARWYIAKEGGRSDVRRLITLGTPHRGAVGALDQLVNGATPGWWKFRPNMTPFVRSLPSLHQLLPEYACIEVDSKLMKLTELELPELDRKMVGDGMLFHDEIDRFPPHRGPVSFYPIGGIRQSTATTATISGRSIVTSNRFEGEELYGDGTVPRLSSYPNKQLETDPAIKWVADQHGALVHNEDVFDQLDGIFTARPLVARLREASDFDSVSKPDRIIGDVPSLDQLAELWAEPPFGLEAPSLIASGETLAVTVSGPVVKPLFLRVTDEAGREEFTRQIRRVDAATRVEIPGLAPGAHRIVAEPTKGGSPRPVTTMTLVWDPKG